MRELAALRSATIGTQVRDVREPNHLRGGLMSENGTSQWNSKEIKLIGSSVFAVVIAVILVCVLVHRGDSLAWLCSAFGLAAGWATGILLAPYQSEQTRFREYAKLLSVFLTGYAVSKVDRLFDLWFDPARGPLILDQVFAHRALIWATSFFLACVSTYVARKYFSSGPGAEQPPTAPLAN
jgi:hypothetical protein